MIKRSLSEFVGTYFLVLVGPGAVVVDSVTGGKLGNLGIAVAFGVIVFLMIAWLGRISGAHINPAVSAALCLSGHLERRMLLPYILSQFLGGIAGAFTLRAIWPDEGSYGHTQLHVTVLDGSLFEFALSAILMGSIFYAIHAEGRRKHVSWIVGATVGIEAFLLGPETGASMNPARSLGPALASEDYTHLWLYLIITTIGAMTTALLYRLRFGKFGA